MPFWRVSLWEPLTCWPAIPATDTSVPPPWPLETRPKGWFGIHWRRLYRVLLAPAATVPEAM
jgi:hypothetical protein